MVPTPVGRSRRAEREPRRWRGSSRNWPAGRCLAIFWRSRRGTLWTWVLRISSASFRIGPCARCPRRRHAFVTCRRALRRRAPGSPPQLYLRQPSAGGDQPGRPNLVGREGQNAAVHVGTSTADNVGGEDEAGIGANTGSTAVATTSGQGGLVQSGSPAGHGGLVEQGVGGHLNDETGTADLPLPLGT